MMHHGIADQNDSADVAAGGQIADHVAEKTSMSFRQIPAVQSETNTAHDIGALRHLGIEAGADSEIVPVARLIS